VHEKGQTINALSQTILTDSFDSIGQDCSIQFLIHPIHSIDHPIHQEFDILSQGRPLAPVKDAGGSKQAQADAATKVFLFSLIHPALSIQPQYSHSTGAVPIN
jgi:hypothetical protein